MMGNKSTLVEKFAQTLFLVFVLICNPLRILAQNQTQILKGRIQNEGSGAAVGTATIILSGPADYFTASDSLGKYHQTVLPGKYTILVQHQNYKSQVRENVMVYSAKQQVEDFQLVEFKQSLEAITVHGRQNRDHPLDMWNLQQFAAVFYDPARVVNSHAGVANTNDQANHISVRGTSPNYIQWRLEGVEVVNPNHLENSGTMNDRASFNGGGVSMISAQLLQSSNFKFAPFDAMSGNALSGIFDIKFRRGNEERNERTLQVSLLGTDLSVEGPFTKKNNSSYLLNFRYSTIGLLSKLGIDFGDERSDYSDFSHVLNFRHRNGTIKIFGLLGRSETEYNGKKDSAQITIEKELTDIDYRSNTAVEGISLITNLSNTTFIKNVIVYSLKELKRSTDPSFPFADINPERDFFSQQKISSLHYLSSRIGNSFRFRIGSFLNQFAGTASILTGAEKPTASKIVDPLIQPFFSVEGNFFKKLEVQAGLHGFYQTRISYFDLQPRMSLKYLINDQQDLTLQYGRSAQLLPFYIYLTNPLNRNLKPTVSDSYSLIHSLQFRANKLKTEIYYQSYNNIPFETHSQFSAFDYFNEQFNLFLNEKHQAKVIGVDFNFSKQFSGFYTILSASFYNSVYNIKGLTKPSRFNTNYNAAITAGKEFRLKKNNRYISCDIRGFNRNGFYESTGVSYFIYNKRLPQYLRFDLRLSYRINKIKSSTIWAIDIQNVTNRKNVGYTYFDKVTNIRETRHQLGLIPVLSYKILF